MLVYSGVSAAYFCSYDDFREVHRAGFEDTREPLRILTTSHYHSYKYRPLNRLVTLLTYGMGRGRPEFFRVRNLVFHVAAVWLVCLIGRQLQLSGRAAALGALLFGVHPLANQSVTIAVSTNTMAHTAFLAALALFLVSVRMGPRWCAWLAGALLSGWLALLLYDSSIVVFALMGAYLGLSWAAHGRPPVSRRFVTAFVACAAVLLVVYALPRAWFVPRVLGEVEIDWPTPVMMARNLTMYVGALFLPFDPVLAQELWGTPLPSEIRLTAPVLAGIVGLGVLAAALCLALARWARSRGTPPGPGEHVGFRFLLCAIAATLAPVLLVTAHASETYVYLPVAFYALLLCGVLERGTAIAPPGRRALLWALGAGLLVFPAFAATWIRNQRVIRCGTTAERVLSGLPCTSLRDGDQTLLFAHRPERPAARRYGHYNFQGLDTIDDGEGKDFTMTAALQVTCGSDRLKGDIVSPEVLEQRCTSPRLRNLLCWWVDDDGTLKEYADPGLGAPLLERRSPGMP